MTEKPYDLVIIGAGPGGYVGGIRAAQLGLRTAIVEKGNLGGVCLNTGCIPAKTLLRHAEVLSTVQDAKRFGVHVGDIQLDLDQVMARKRSVVNTLRQGVEGLLMKNKVTIVRGEGRIVAAPMRIEGPVGSVDAEGEVAVRTQEGIDVVLKTHNIVLATGARPRVLPGVEFDEQYIVSTTGALSMSSVPRRLAIVGAGPAGVEFAYAYRVFGAERVTVIEALPRILPQEDAAMSSAVTESLEKRGIRVETGARATDIVRDGELIRFELTTSAGGRESLVVDRLLVAIGIEPVTDGLGLDEANVMRNPRGLIVVDEHLRTSAPGVFAIGDVTPTTPLANVASAEGILVAEQIAGLGVTPLDYDKMPRGVYAHPEVGSVGLTEEQAREQGYDVRVGTFAYRGNGRALLMGHTEGVVKVVSEDRYGEVLGVHLFGAEATTMLGEAGLALAFEFTDEELGRTSHAHPTLSEIIQEAALAASGRAMHG